MSDFFANMNVNNLLEKTMKWLGIEWEIDRNSNTETFLDLAIGPGSQTEREEVSGSGINIFPNRFTIYLCSLQKRIGSRSLVDECSSGSQEFLVSEIP